MKAGDHTHCPHCGENTFVKEEVVMDGWQVKGKKLVCALCGHKLGEVAAAAERPAAAAADPAKLSALAGLLGAEAEAKPDLGLRQTERRFCKDCRHFLVHPFMTRCSKFDRDVDPMGDCLHYQPRPKTPGKDS